MITDAVLALLFLPLRLVLDAVPVVSWPDWFQTSGTGSVVAMTATWGGYVGVLNGWFPVPQFFSALDVVATCVLASIGIKVTRILVSLFTGGGGSAF